MREFIIKFSDADAEQLIEGMEEAKGSEITRCEQCIFYNVPYDSNDIGWCDEWESDTDADGFCHRGKPDSYEDINAYTLDKFFNHPIEQINDLIESVHGRKDDKDGNDGKEV